MYQNCCKKCGSISLHTETKGNNVGLYCNDCGAWIKWLGKNELRAFEHAEKEEKKDMKAYKKQDCGWIPCSERLPEAETEVLITTVRKFRGENRYIVTTAIYEDGTVLENDSEWNWQDIDGEYNEEEDCYIVPQGWWEYRHYNTDEVYNNVIDDEVIAWMPLPIHAE